MQQAPVPRRPGLPSVRHPDAEQALDVVRTLLLSRSAFFASLVLQTPVSFTYDVPTAAVDGERMYVNPDFFMKYRKEEQIGLVCHETLHMAFDDIGWMEHLNRDDPGFDAELMLHNMAADYVINLAITDSKIPLPAGGLLDYRYANMTREEVLEELRRNPPDQQQCQHSQSSPPRDGSGQPGADDDSPASRAGKPLPGEGDGGPGRDVMAPPQRTAEERARAKQRAQARLASAVQHAKMAGSLPAGIERLVGDLLTPVLPWRALLHRFFDSWDRSQYSWRRRNRRYPDMILPGRHGRALAHLVLVVDTSGSIGGPQFDAAIAEIEEVRQRLQPRLMTVACCDTEVSGVTVVDRSTPLPRHYEATGGGGTDMGEAVRWACTLATPPTALVVITDMYTPWGDAPAFPVLWVDNDGSNIEPPYGTVVRLRA